MTDYTRRIIYQKLEIQRERGTSVCYFWTKFGEEMDE